MARVNRLVMAGWSIERYSSGTRYVILFRAGARRIAIDRKWDMVWVIGQ